MADVGSVGEVSASGVFVSSGITTNESSASSILWAGVNEGCSMGDIGPSSSWVSIRTVSKYDISSLPPGIRPRVDRMAVNTGDSGSSVKGALSLLLDSGGLELVLRPLPSVWTCGGPGLILEIKLLILFLPRRASRLGMSYGRGGRADEDAADMDE